MPLNKRSTRRGCNISSLKRDGSNLVGPCRITILNPTLLFSVTSTTTEVVVAGSWWATSTFGSPWCTTMDTSITMRTRPHRQRKHNRNLTARRSSGSNRGQELDVLWSIKWLQRATRQNLINNPTNEGGNLVKTIPTEAPCSGNTSPSNGQRGGRRHPRSTPAWLTGVGSSPSAASSNFLGRWLACFSCSSTIRCVCSISEKKGS